MVEATGSDAAAAAIVATALGLAAEDDMSDRSL
jgi:hypothetical protein